MADSKVSPGAVKLARELGYDPAKVFGPVTLYSGLDNVPHRDPESAIEASQRVETDFSRGASGGCNQDSSKVSK